MGIPYSTVLILSVSEEAIITLETSLASVGASPGQHVTVEVVKSNEGS